MFRNKQQHKIYILEVFQITCKKIRDGSILGYCTKININFEKIDSGRGKGIGFYIYNLFKI